MKSRLGFALLTMGFSGLVAQMLLLRELHLGDQTAKSHRE